jgi:ubiquinone/menaquinone biosynthesis C-methylase UbiE
VKTHNYERFAKAYAELGITDTFFLAYRDIPELLENYVTGKKALDYGCGGGRSTRVLKSLGFNAIGVDVSADMIREAKERDPQGNYQKITQKLPFPAESFDLVLSSIVLLETPSLEKMTKIVSEMKRVLKKKGAIIIITGTPEAYSCDAASFICDFPENKHLKSGDKAKGVLRGTDVVLYDYVWFDEDYRSVFRNAKLNVVDARKPLATGKEPYNWISEKEVAPWIIYTLRK